MKSTLVSTVLTTLAFMVGAFVWYSVLTPGLHGSPIARSEPVYPLMMLSNLCAALMLVLVTERRTERSAFGVGAAMGVMWVLPTNLMTRAIWQVDLTIGTPLDTIFHALLAGGCAVLAVKIHGRLGGRREVLTPQAVR